MHMRASRVDSIGGKGETAADAVLQLLRMRQGDSHFEARELPVLPPNQGRIFEYDLDLGN